MKLENVKIIHVLTPQTGTSKDGNKWSKQEIIVETQEKYPKKICMATWNDAFTKIVKQGTFVDIEFDIESRLYNERWYTDCKIFKLQLANTQKGSNKNDLPETDFPYPSINDAPVEKQEENNGKDDLPF